MVLLDEVDVSNPDAFTLEKLKSAQRRLIGVNNEFLKMKPEDIPRDCVFKGKSFYVDNFCILTDDKMEITTDGAWEKLERGQGWGVAGANGWVGWKRTFVYKPSTPSRSNKKWLMKVYAVVEGNGSVKPLYECHVFEDYNCEPRPKCISQLPPALVDTIQEDPVEVESLAKQLEAIATNPNLLPYVERQDHNAYAWFPSIGVDKSLRAEVWKTGKFSRIKARCPDGGEIYWPLCNHCGMVYKGTTLPVALEKHKCDCSCRLAPNS